MISLAAVIAGLWRHGRGLQKVGAALMALVLLSVAAASYELPVGAQESGDAGQAASQNGDDEDPSQRDVPPGCYRDPNAGDIIICPSVSISANPPTITPGHSATLSWSSSHTTSRSINHGIGSVGTSGNTSVSPSSTTNYTITGYSPAGSHTASVTVTVRTLEPPPAPSGFSASADGETHINLSWNSRSGVTIYHVQGRSSSITGTSERVGGLQSCTEYTFNVRGHGDGTTYAATWGPWATTSGSTACLPPPAPSGFSASADGETHINLSWNSRSGVPIYHVQGRSSSITGTSERVGGLQPGTEYTFKVRGHGDGSRYAATWGPWATTSGRTDPTPTPTPTPVPTPTPPPPPTGPTGSISADSTNIPPGGCTTLRWSTQHATSVSIDQGIGSVGTNGSQEICPTSTTTYTLSASGPGGSITRSVRVQAGGPELPGPVAELRVQTTGKNTVTVEWDRPGAGSATRTGYRVQNRQVGTDWPANDGADEVGAEATSWTLRGLINGTPYYVRIQACYGTAGCSGWTQLSDTVIPGNKVGNARLEVAKTTIDIGERLQVTIYDIPYGKVAYMNMYGSIQPEGQCPERSGEALPRRVGEPSTGGWYDSSRIDGCPDGGRGHIRVTNADESELYAYVTITVNRANPPAPPPGPEPITEIDPPPPLPPPTCDPIPQDLPPAPDTLDKPTNLTVTPRLRRQAVLRWQQVPTAEKYRIYARRLTNDPVDGLNWDAWASPTKASSHYVTANCYLIILDNVIERRARSHGFPDTLAFGLRVTAIRSGSTPASDEIVLVNNPIAMANGHSPSRDPEPSGQVQLAWQSVEDLFPGSDYSGGTHYFRYRQANDNHNTVNWPVGVFILVDTKSESELHEGTTIQGLNREAIYALQAIYSKRDQPTVFSAVDVYVWPSESRARDGQRVATFPLSQRLPNHRTYEYRVCGDTFDIEGDARKEDWLALIKDAFGKWEAATSNLVRGREILLPCTNYSGVVNKVVKKIGEIDPSRSKELRTNDVEAFLNGTVHGLLIDPMPSDNIIEEVRIVNQEDRETSEIIMYDDSPRSTVGTVAYLATEVYFKQIARLIGYSICWDPEYEPSTTHNRVQMCAVSEFANGQNEDGGVTTDIFVYRHKYKDKSLDSTPSDAMLQECMTDRDSAFGGFLHEVGHALGIGGGSDRGADGYKWPDTFHPVGALSDSSVMASALPNCSPYPFDVLAIYALYQSS